MLASPMAVALPMPEVAPVIRQTFSPMPPLCFSHSGLSISHSLRPLKIRGMPSASLENYSLIAVPKALTLSILPCSLYGYQWYQEHVFYGVRQLGKRDQPLASSSSAQETASSSVITRPLRHASSHASSPMPVRTAEMRASASARKSVSLGMSFTSCKACAAPHSRAARSDSLFAPATQASPSKALCTIGFIPVSHERERLSL